MKNYSITEAFKSLDDLCEVKITKLKEAKEDDREHKEGLTFGDLLAEESSYITTYDFEHNGKKWSLFIEGLDDAQSCDAIYDTFDLNNVNGVLVELLDEDREFVDSVANHSKEDFFLDTPIEEAVKIAKEEIIDKEDDNDLGLTDDEFERSKEDVEFEETEVEESCKKEESKLNERQGGGEQYLCSFEHEGMSCEVFGEKSSTRDYHWEEVRIYDRKRDYKVVGYGRYKWLNRPWQRFDFASALREALVELLGKDRKAEIDTAIDTSSNCKEVCEKLFAHKEDTLKEENEEYTWINVELPKDKAEELKTFLRDNNFYFEPSGCGSDCVHFEIKSFDKDKDTKTIDAFLSKEKLGEEKECCSGESGHAKFKKSIAVKEPIKESPENPETNFSVKNEGETLIKQAGHSGLFSKGNGKYVVRYAPGYLVNEFEAESDEQAINKFLGLEESQSQEIAQAVSHLNKAFDVDFDELLKQFEDETGFDGDIIYNDENYDKFDKWCREKGIDVNYFSKIIKFCKDNNIEISFKKGESMFLDKFYQLIIVCKDSDGAMKLTDYLTNKLGLGYEWDTANGEIKPSLVVKKGSDDEKEFILPLLNEKNESLTESEHFNIQSDKELEKAKELQDEKEEESPIEQVIDPNAEIQGDIKTTYVGNAILQCPVCKTMIYKEPDELVKDETDEEGKTYNVDEECPHCGSKDGFELVGQVATLDVETNTEDEEEQKSSEEETKEVEKSTEEPEQAENKEEKNEFALESFNETQFDKLAEHYLKEVYSNVKSYKTVDGSVDKNAVIFEGVITFNSGKEKKTKFVFESVKLTKKGKVKLTGLNETFSKNAKTFTLVGTIKDSELLSESLSYNYSVEDKEVSGKVANHIRRA